MDFDVIQRLNRECFEHLYYKNLEKLDEMGKFSNMCALPILTQKDVNKKPHSNEWDWRKNKKCPEIFYFHLLPIFWRRVDIDAPQRDASSKKEKNIT